MKKLTEVYKDSGLGKWFGQSAGGEPGWDRYNTKGERVGKCGDSKPGEGKPKCLSPEKARKLRAQGGKKAIGNAAKRKKSQDPDTDRPGTGNKPINVSNNIKKEETMKSFSTYLQEKNKPTNPKLWASSIAAAKSKFDVYPSAYANAWASKHYKSKGGGWTKVSEDFKSKDAGRIGAAISNRRDLDTSEKNAARRSLQRKAAKADRKTNAHNVNADAGRRYRVGTKRPVDQNNPKHKGLVGNRAVSRAMDADRKAGYSTESMQVEEGIKDRVTRYVKSFGPEHKMDKKDRILAQQARAQKGSKSRLAGAGTFRNFRAAKLKKQRAETNEASAAWQRKEGKNKEGGLNAAGRASYERENPGSDLKAPVSSMTANKNPDGKAAKRRKSFCARMGGMPGAMKKPNGEPTRKALALRKWDC